MPWLSRGYRMTRNSSIFLFPVDGLNASYEDLFNVYSEIVADLSEAERSAVFGGNAERVYRLCPGEGRTRPPSVQATMRSLDA